MSWFQILISWNFWPYLPPPLLGRMSVLSRAFFFVPLYYFRGCVWALAAAAVSSNQHPQYISVPKPSRAGGKHQNTSTFIGLTQQCYEAFWPTITNRFVPSYFGYRSITRMVTQNWQNSFVRQPDKKAILGFFLRHKSHQDFLLGLGRALKAVQ